MEISRTTFYRRPIRQEKMLKSDLELRDEIEKIHLELPGYGYRRIREHLLRCGRRINSKKIRRVMKEFSIFSCRQKTTKPRGGAIGKKLVHPNLIRGLKLTAPNQVWATDITFIRLLREYICLSAIIDIYTRKIVGWAIGKTIDHKFITEALKTAIKNENPPKGVIHHSDRGSQYCSIEYNKFLKEQGFRVSMSKVGTPEDNAFIEAFFKTVKREEVYFKNYKTREEVIKNLPKFIDEVYNTKRLHSSLGYKTPKEFEAEILNINPANRPVQKIWGWAANK
jgi:putative transposase